MAANPNKLSLFWNELKRRKVLPILIGYLTASVAIIELSSNASDTFSLSDNTVKLLWLFAAIGIPIVILLPWFINRKKSIAESDDSSEKKHLILSEKSKRQDNSIIVLPFENISSDPDQEYFSDGLTEEIITDLSYIEDLLVISRSSAMTFKGTKKTLKEITDAVNVRYALEGSVRKAGNNIRIVAQLIDGTNDSHIWADKYNGTLEDIFDVQEKVSQSIAEALKIKLSSREKEKIDQHQIDNVLAYDCYLRAIREISSFSKERLDLGLELLHKGNEYLPENPVIYAGMAFAFFQYANLGIESDKNVKQAEEYIDKALLIDPKLAEAHTVQANIMMVYYGNLHKAVTHYKIALNSKPDNLEAMGWLGWCYHLVGKTDDAIAIGEKSIKLDPLNTFNQYLFRGVSHFMTGQFKLALEPWFSVYRLQPETSLWQLWKALVLMYNDRPDEAFEFLNEAVKESEEDSCSRLLVFLKYAIRSDKKKLTSILTPDFIKAIKMDCQYSWHLAAFYSFINEKDQALEWLEHAVNRGFINYPFLKNHDRLLDNIRSEERFQTLLERVKYEWENFEV
jgi:non-specific serine/threonine protein kinase